MSDSNDNEMDFLPSSSKSETSEYDVTSDKVNSNCHYSLKFCWRWAWLYMKNLFKEKKIHHDSYCECTALMLVYVYKNVLGSITHHCLIYVIDGKYKPHLDV